RIGVADWSPNGELSIDRTDGRRKIGIGAYRRLVAANDWGDPLGFSSSVSALFFGRDEGFYYRTWGAELTGEKDYGLISNWRLFFIGGVGTVRGQRAGAGIGDSFWTTSAEIGTRNAGFRKIVFGDLGWAGNRANFSHPGRPLSGAGIGASFMDGLIRLDLAKGIYPEKSARANLYVEARF